MKLHAWSLVLLIGFFSAGCGQDEDEYEFSNPKWNSASSGENSKQSARKTPEAPKIPDVITWPILLEMETEAEKLVEQAKDADLQTARQMGTGMSVKLMVFTSEEIPYIRNANEVKDIRREIVADSKKLMKAFDYEKPELEATFARIYTNLKAIREKGGVEIAPTPGPEAPAEEAK